MTIALHLTYDPDANAMYLRLREGLAAETIEIEESVYVDLDADGRPLGMEFLNPTALPDFLGRHGGQFTLPERVTDALAVAS